MSLKTGPGILLFPLFLLIQSSFGKEQFTTKSPTTTPIRQTTPHIHHHKIAKRSLSQGITILCEENHMEIDIDTTNYPDLDPYEFHLTDINCVSTVSGKVIQLRTPLNGCGTTIVETTNGTTYKNEVRAYHTMITTPGISVTRQDDLTLPFNCTYGRKKMVSMTSFKPLRKVEATETSLGNFTFEMDLFSTDNFQSSYTPNDYPIEVDLNDPINVQFKVNSQKGDLHIFAEKCLATTTTSEKSKPSYVFLENGCALDSTMVYKYSPNRVQNFTIDAFRFISDNPLVYLHCLLLVCHSSSKKTKCAAGCTSKKRKRREISRGSTDIDESKLYHLTSGPLITRKRTKYSNPDPTPDSGFEVIVIASVASFSIILLITSIFLGICLVYHKRRAVNLKELEPLQLRQYDGDAVFVSVDI